MSEEYLLQMRSISKEYAGNAVLKDVDLNVRAGEIHALLGENGAGKSTLMNILFGMPVIRDTGAFSGRILLKGESVSISSPQDAMNLGIGMVHQEFMLIPGFKVYENLKLNREKTSPNVASRVMGRMYETLDAAAMREDSKLALKKVGMELGLEDLAGDLPIGHMQFLEIAREVDKTKVDLLVFDEPTAVLNESEAQGLLSCMRRLAGMGIAIIFITHRLQEVIDVCDRVTVLRDGALVKTAPVPETDLYRLAEWMVGRQIDRRSTQDRTERFDDDIIMKIQDLSVNMPGEQVKGVNLKVRRGEILGIGGLAGQGKLGIANGIMGMYPASGDIIFNGELLQLNDTNAVLKRKIAFLSEDRKRVGLLLDESIEDNMVFSAMQVNREYLHDFGFASFRKAADIRSFSRNMIADFDIRCVGPKQPVGSLSGGNQQKVCLCKALALKPDFLFVSEPTRGIDIGAKKLVLDKLQELSRKKGVTVVVASSELSELRSICDRIAIVNNGTIAGILSPSESDARFGLVMTGATLSETEGQIHE